MDTRQLRAFCAVVELKSFSQAAERLGVTQPAVSLQVRSLEKRLDRKLLDRSARRVEPTEAGVALFPGAQRMLHPAGARARALPRGAADAAARGAAGRGARPGRGRRARRHARGRRLHRPGQHGGAGAALRVPARALGRRGLALDRRHATGGRARRRAGTPARGRWRRAKAPRGRLRTTLPRRGRARRPARPPLRRSCGDARRAARRAADRDAGGRRREAGDRGRAARRRDAPARPGAPARARPAGVGQGGGGRGLRRHLHLARGDRGRPRRRHAGGRARAGPRPGAPDLARPRGRALADAGRRGVRRLRAGTAVIVRWGLVELEGLLAELGLERPYLIASERWSELPLPNVGRWSEVPTDRIAEVAAATRDADGVLAAGGGSAIDLGKAVSAETGLPLVSVPTTYSGAEWTTFFGVRDPDRLMKGGGAGAHPAGILYEPRLTLDLPRDQSGGTALNALAHCAEALYVAGHNPEGDREALAGAKLIDDALPRVLADGHDLKARTRLLEGAQHAGAALGSAGLALGHAMAQALGGRYGIAHGAANALTLPPALRFNQPFVPEAIRGFGEALGVDDPAARAEELARVSGFTRLRELGVSERELGKVAAAVVQ